MVARPPPWRLGQYWNCAIGLVHVAARRRRNVPECQVQYHRPSGRTRPQHSSEGKLLSFRLLLLHHERRAAPRNIFNKLHRIMHRSPLLRKKLRCGMLASEVEQGKKSRDRLAEFMCKQIWLKSFAFEMGRKVWRKLHFWLCNWLWWIPGGWNFIMQYYFKFNLREKSRLPLRKACLMHANGYM